MSRLIMAAVLLVVAAACAAPAHAAPRKVTIPRTLARDIGREIDLLRKNPKAYARHLEALRSRYDGKLLRLDGRDPIRTKEGKKPLELAIKRLKKTKAMKALAWESGLARAAADHAGDIGARGVVEHDGPKGESPIDRVQRYGILQGRGGENIAVAFSDARMVVLYLLIDDGVADRGHREALLDRRYEQVGVACGPHEIYRVVCVMDFAAGYASLVK